MSHLTVYMISGNQGVNLEKSSIFSTCIIHTHSLNSVNRTYIFNIKSQTTSFQCISFSVYWIFRAIHARWSLERVEALVLLASFTKTIAASNTYVIEYHFFILACDYVYYLYFCLYFLALRFRIVLRVSN